ncbi:MAG TPA: ThuA domain-containing protein [Planctomycetaceae bacterium]|nr:ThuA domain-containing protein [Planctomycetaceae bacterium]
MIFRKSIVSLILICLTSLATSTAEAKRILLLWQSPDGHPVNTHEYETGIKIIANWFHKNTEHQVIVSQADEPWEEGPQLLNQADSVVMYLAQGAQWIRKQPARLKAFQGYVAQGGGLCGLHWAIGSKRDEDIPDFVKLLGAIHGGSDRKYQFLKTEFRPAANSHPIQHGLKPMTIEDEFYYRLKTVKSATPVVPLMESLIEGEWYMTSWAWERPDGGRSFGFSGLHYHVNWGEENYRRLVFQGILWTLKEEIPPTGLTVDIDPAWLALPKRENAAK